MAKVQKAPLITDGNFTVEDTMILQFFSLTGKESKTKGTSCKSYVIELHKSKISSEAQVYSLWGPTGGTMTKDWRYFSSIATARKEYDKIIKSKKKKGYQEVDVAQRAYGSDAAKQITKAVQFKNADSLKTALPKSTLHLATQRLVEQLFGATNQFVVTTLKCPLGQLTNAQIDKGRDCLNEAKQIVNASKKLSKPNQNRITELTNEFYTLIPHNLGTGSRGQMTHLLLDDLTKIMGKEDDLDTLLDAKSVGAALAVDAGIDAKYKELQAELTWIDPSDPVFKFMSDYFMRSKVSGHGYRSAKVKNLWAMRRNGKGCDTFLLNSDKIAKQCGKHMFVKEATRLNRDVKLWTPDKRPDLNKEEKDIFMNANTWLCWHGTRSANVIGISKKGLLIRPSGAVHTGSLYGDGKYFAWQSTKSLNYTDGGYWTGGRRNNSSRFMFLLDVSLGNMHVATYNHFYRSAPKGFHSVYGKASRSGVMNDEMITYDFKNEDQQSRIRYLFEISD